MVKRKFNISLILSIAEYWDTSKLHRFDSYTPVYFLTLKFATDMQFEMHHKVGTDYSTVNIYNISKLKEESRIKLYEVLNKLGMTFGKGDEIRFPFCITSEVLQEVIHNTCFVCGGLMKDGQALDNTYVYSNDFGNDAGQYGTTCSKIGQPVMKQIRKCNSCGHSHT